MKKRIVSLALALMLVFTFMGSAVAAVWSDGSNAYWDTVNYGSDWRLWRQTAAPKGSYMNLYGCWVVAMSKLVAESGAAPSGFNPGVYVKWEKANGYIGSGFGQIHKGGSGYAPVAYAKARGVSMSLTRGGAKTEKQLLALLKNNYLIVKVLTGTGGSHYAYVARDESLRDGKIYYRDSWGSKALTPFNQKLEGRTYGAYEVWAYSLPAGKSAETTAIDLVTVAEGEFMLSNGTRYLNATKDSEGGNVNTAAKSDNTALIWRFVKSGNTYAIESKMSPTKRVLNVYTDQTSAAGKNVTLYKKTGDGTQLWVFEQKDNAFIVHPADNLNVALTLLSDGDVKLAASTGAASQLWVIEDLKAEEIVTIAPEEFEKEPEALSEELTEVIEDILEEEPEPEIVIIANEQKNDIELTAVVTSVGVKFDWTPNSNALGYRIYRSEYPNSEGISITDFPITDKEYVDVNVSENTTYYYCIREVLAEAKFNIETMELTPEVRSYASEQLTIDVAELTVDEMLTKHFILMQLGKEDMRVDEEIMEIDPGRGTTPMTVNGRTLVPIRAIIEAMGGSVGWEDSESKITLIANEHSIEMWVGNKDIKVDGADMSMDVAPDVINERTMLPVRFVAENAGCQIEWIGSTQQIIIVFYK